MHILGVGSPEFEGPNVFAKAGQQERTVHKQPKPHTHWRHREPVFERETPREALIANAQVLLRGMAHVLSLARERLTVPVPDHSETMAPLGNLAVHAAMPGPVEHEESAA